MPTIAIDKKDKAPLREEVAKLLLTVLVRDATDKDLARITAIVKATLFVVLVLWLGKTHLQRTADTWEVLWINYSSISISCKVEGCKSIRRLVAILCMNNVDLEHMAVLRKMPTHLRLASVLWQGSNEDLQVLLDGQLIIPVWAPHHLTYCRQLT